MNAKEKPTLMVWQIPEGTPVNAIAIGSNTIFVSNLPDGTSFVMIPGTGCLCMDPGSLSELVSQMQGALHIPWTEPGGHLTGPEPARAAAREADASPWAREGLGRG